jgi:hypothetical protein
MKKIKLFNQPSRPGVKTVTIDNKYAGSVIDHSIAKKLKRSTEETLNIINSETEDFDNTIDNEEFVEAIDYMLQLDDTKDTALLSELIESYHSTKFLERNKALEYIACNRIKKELPEGWTAEVSGQSDSTKPDIAIYDNKGSFQYYVEVKMSNAQAAPLVVSKVDGLWVANSSTPSIYDTARLNILNRPENLNLEAGKPVTLTESEIILMKKAYQEELINKNVKDIYVVDVNKDNDKRYTASSLSTNSNIQVSLMTPRAKASGSASVPTSRVQEVTEAIKSLNKDHVSINQKVDNKGKTRTIIYLKEELGNRNDERRHLSEEIYLSGGSSKPVYRTFNDEVVQVYPYEVRLKSSKPNSTGSWTSLNQLSFN